MVGQPETKVLSLIPRTYMRKMQQCGTLQPVLCSETSEKLTEQELERRTLGFTLDSDQSLRPLWVSQRSTWLMKSRRQKHRLPPRNFLGSQRACEDGFCRGAWLRVEEDGITGNLSKPGCRKGLPVEGEQHLTNSRSRN